MPGRVPVSVMKARPSGPVVTLWSDVLIRLGVRFSMVRFCPSISGSSVRVSCVLWWITTAGVPSIVMPVGRCTGVDTVVVLTAEREVPA